jgi:hypothetical protein
VSTNDSNTDELPVVAWTVEIHSMTCVVFATTKAKAQWLATKSFWDAFGNVGWPGAKAFRAEPYDKSRLRLEKGKAWQEGYVIETL